MENVVSSYEDTRKYHLNEFEFYDGEESLSTLYLSTLNENLSKSQLLIAVR